MTKLDISKVASDNSLLAAMPLPAFALLVPHLKPFMPTQGEVLIEQESIVESVYFPLEGLFSLVTVMDGSAIELGAVGNEYAIGLSEVLAQRPSIARAAVQVSGATLVVPADVVRRIVLKCSRLRELSLCCEQALLIQLAQTSACNALHSLECRLARWLLQTSDRVNTTSVVLTQDFMSQMLGVSRTAVTLLARKLQKAEITRYSRGHIEILDRVRLEHASCECYHNIKRRVSDAYRACNVHRPLTVQYSPAPGLSPRL